MTTFAPIAPTTVDSAHVDVEALEAAYRAPAYGEVVGSSAGWSLREVLVATIVGGLFGGFVALVVLTALS